MTDATKQEACAVDAAQRGNREGGAKQAVYREVKRRLTLARGPPAALQGLLFQRTKKPCSLRAAATLKPTVHKTNNDKEKVIQSSAQYLTTPSSCIGVCMETIYRVCMYVF